MVGKTTFSRTHEPNKRTYDFASPTHKQDSDQIHPMYFLFEKLLEFSGESYLADPFLHDPFSCVHSIVRASHFPRVLFSLVTNFCFCLSKIAEISENFPILLLCLCFEYFSLNFLCFHFTKTPQNSMFFMRKCSSVKSNRDYFRGKWRTAGNTCQASPALDGSREEVFSG